jgi:hypothetical protein
MLNIFPSLEDIMDFRLRPLPLASVAVAALGLAFGATLVQAQTAEKTRHCVQSLTEPDTRAVCYDNFAEAMAAATGGQIADAPPEVRDAMNDPGLLEKLNRTGEKKDAPATASARDRLVVAILFSDHNFQGSTLTFFRNRACTTETTDIDHSSAYVGDDWNDEGMSIRVFNNCFARLWEHRDFQGAMLDFAGDRSDFGALMDEEVSSLQFS